MKEDLKNIAIIAFGVSIVLFFFLAAGHEMGKNWEPGESMTTDEYSQHVKNARLLHEW